MMVDNAYALPWVVPWSAATQCMGRVKRRSVQQLRFTHRRTRVRNPCQRILMAHPFYESRIKERWGPEREFPATRIPYGLLNPRLGMSAALTDVRASTIPKVAIGLANLQLGELPHPGHGLFPSRERNHAEWICLISLFMEIPTVLHKPLFVDSTQRTETGKDER